jgi:hypothetical protein
MTQLNNSDIGGHSMNFNDYRLRLSDPASFLLREIGKKRINVSSIPDESDEVLAELMNYNLVELDPYSNGILRLTEKGKEAIDKSIALVYPEPVEGSIKGFIPTIETRSPNAWNAWWQSIAKRIDYAFPKELPRRTVGTLLQALLDINIERRTPAYLAFDVYARFRDSVFYYMSDRTKWSPKSYGEAMMAELTSFETAFNSYFSSHVEDLREIKLKEPVKLGNYLIEKLVWQDGVNIAVIDESDLKVRNVQLCDADLNFEQKIELMTMIR